MRIAQISDFHYTHITWNPLRLLSKRILGNLNWLLTRSAAFAEEQIEMLPELFDQLGVDLVLLGGDFTTTALQEEYEKASQFVSRIKKPTIAIPGNHDHYTKKSFGNKHFYRYFSNHKQEILHPTDFFHLSDHRIEVHPIAPNWWLIALDTARATNFHSSAGIFTEKQEAYFKEILNLIPPGDSIICFNHYPFFPQDAAKRNLERGDALQKILHDHPRIRLYLHGHTHRHAIADLQPNGLPILLDSGCCVQKRTGTWNLIDLMPDDCVVSAYRWNGSWEPFRQEKIAWKRI